MQLLSTKKNKLLLLLPTCLVYVVYIILPILVSLYYSFTKYSGISKPRLYGLKNYIRLLDDPYFWIALKNTAIILGISILLLGIGAFFVAMLLNQPMRGVNVCKALIFAPAIIASIIAGVIWGYLLDPVTGLVNNVLRAIGLDKLALEWIGGKTLSPYSIAFVYFWQQAGYIAAIYLAGLKTIPNEMMEAAAVDGTNFWQRLLHVTIPALRDTFVSVGILIITGSMKIFETVQQLTGGGPTHYSETLVTYAYNTTFARGEYGYGMALATATFLISLILMGIYTSAARERLRGPAMRVRKKLGVCYVLMVLLTIAIVIPIIWLVFISMKPNSEIMNNPLSLPNALDFGNYVSALQTLDLFTLYKNTAFIAVCSLAVEIVITFSSAVGLTRLYYRSDGVRSGLQGFLQLGLAVSPFILLFPIYKINKFLGFSQQLSLILPYIATSISFNTLLFTAYLRTVPKELDEAALMDGVSLWQLMTKILVPIAKPVLATVIIFNLLYIWNEYPFASIMIEKPAYYTISRGIAAFQGQYNIDYGGLAAYSVMVLLPELVFYGIFQRHVVDGMTVGAVKG